ncbi:hypothetical protein ACFQV2_00190 [Actinokineospora soli]|uniref:Uncharacterized protein n=1 Tax=Actinokineospora soli TaxID=1048753 RepID=A0ABW2TFB5_9PSEU
MNASTSTALPPVPHGLADDFTAGACLCTGRLHVFGSPECDAAAG